MVGGDRAKAAANCDDANADNPDCAATKRVTLDFPDYIVTPKIADPGIITVDQTAFASSASADRPRLGAALGAYYRSEWPQGTEALKAANADDPNVQFVHALLDLGSGTDDGAHDAQDLLRKAAAAGQRQAGAVLGGTLMGWQDLPKNVAEGRGLIEKASASGDVYAMRLAAIGYLSGEFGARDTAKAFTLMGQAADAGEPVAMAYVGWFYHSGLGVAADKGKALDYLNRAAEAGLTGIQLMLADWEWDTYNNKQSAVPGDSFKWYERAYQRGHSLMALGYLADGLWHARAPYDNFSRARSLLQLCAHFAYGYCQYWLGEAYYSDDAPQDDLINAYARYVVAVRVGADDNDEDAKKWIAELDKSLPAAARTTAKNLADNIAASLKPIPPVIELQTADAIAGSATWNLPRSDDAVPVLPSVVLEPRANSAPAKPDGANGAPSRPNVEEHPK